MVQFTQTGAYPQDYVTVAAGQTNSILSNTGVGAKGDFLYRMVIIAGATPGTCVLKDGSTTVVTYQPAASTMTTFSPETYSTSGTWNVTTGSNVSIFATGNFT